MEIFIRIARNPLLLAVWIRCNPNSSSLAISVSCNISWRLHPLPTSRISFLTSYFMMCAFPTSRASFASFIFFSCKSSICCAQSVCTLAIQGWGGDLTDLLNRIPDDVARNYYILRLAESMDTFNRLKLYHGVPAPD